jgi:hypothetical protein
MTNINASESPLNSLQVPCPCQNDWAQPCKNASMPNGRCKMHGGKSTGRPITHGLRSKIAIEDRKTIKTILQTLKGFN